MPADSSPDSEMEVDSEYTLCRRIDSDLYICQPSDTLNKKSKRPDAKSPSNRNTNDCTNTSWGKKNCDIYFDSRRWLIGADPVPEFGPKKFQKTVPVNSDRNCRVTEILFDGKHSESVEDDTVVSNALSTPESMQGTVRTLRWEKTLFGEDVASFLPDETLVRDNNAAIPANKVEDTQKSERLENSTPDDRSRIKSVVNLDKEGLVERLRRAKIAYNKGAVEHVNAKTSQKRKSTEMDAADERSAKESVPSQTGESISQRLRNAKKAVKSAIPPLISSIKLRSGRKTV